LGRQERQEAGAIEALRNDPVFVLGQFVLVGKIALTLFAFDPIAADTFTLVKSTLAHAGGVVLLAILIALALRHGTALLTLSWVTVAAAAVVVSFAVAVVFAVDGTIALYGASRRFLGMTQILDDALVYAAALVLLPTPADLRRVCAATGVAALLVALYGALQHFGVDVIRYEIPTIRPISSLGQPDILAGLLSIAIATLLGVAVLFWSRLRAVERAGLVLALAIEVAVLQFTGVRNSLLGIGAGLVAVAVIWVLRRGSLPSRRPLLIGVGLGLFILGAVAIPLAGRLTPATLSKDPAVAGRVEAWKVAIGTVMARPVLGVGPDNFVAVYRTARTEEAAIASLQEPYDSTHNWLLYSATSAGIAGAIATVALVATAFVAAGRLARMKSPFAVAAIPLAAYLGQGLVNVNDISLDWVMWLSAGAIAAGGPRPVGWWPARARPRLWSAATACLLGAIALLATAGSLQRITGSELFKSAIATAQDGQGATAIEFARSALRIDPRRAEYWNAFGDALAVAGNANAAATAFADAAARAPWDPGYPRNIALQKVRLGDVPGATRAIQRSLELDPNDPDSLDISARFTFNRGDYAEAARIGAKATRLLPTIVSFYEVPVRSYMQLKQYQDAERLLDSGLSAINDAHLHVLLGRVYLLEGRRGESARQADLALALRPDLTEAKDLRSQLGTP
jgi:tetratricopeptide (TPR) repeat protein